MLRKMSVVAGGVLSLAFVSLLYAQGMMQGGQMPMMHRGMMQGGQMSMMHRGGMMFGCGEYQMGHHLGFYLNFKEELGLSQKQVERLKKIKISFQKARIQKEADLQIKELELNELLSQPSAQRSTIEAKAREVEKLRSELRMIRLRARLDAREVLTPEQFKKAQSLSSYGRGMMWPCREEKETEKPQHMMMR